MIKKERENIANTIDAHSKFVDEIKFTIINLNENGKEKELPLKEIERIYNKFFSPNTGG